MDVYETCALFLSLSVLACILHRFVVSKSKYPSNLPWVGMREEFFALYRAHQRDSHSAPLNLAEAYSKYTKHGRACIVPSITHRPVVLLPRSWLSWLRSQPDDDLSISEVLKDEVHFDYLSPDSWNFHNSFHIEAINKLNVDATVQSINQEIEGVLPEALQFNEDGLLDRPLASVILEVITCITSRVFVDPVVSRDPKYTYHLRAFVRLMPFIGSLITQFIPQVLRPLLARIIGVSCRYHNYRCGKVLAPLIKHHLTSEMSRKRDELPSVTSYETILQSMAHYARRSTHLADSDPRSMAARILSLNFVAIHTSTTTMVNTILDIMSHPKAEQLWCDLRVEAQTASDECTGSWDKHAVAKLKLSDSCIRESLRLRTFKGRAIEREVTKMEGIDLPDGTHLPQHTRIAFPVKEIHSDFDIFKYANIFDPWRFFKGQPKGTEVFGASGSLVNVTDDFLAFGYGKHACPGRFLAAIELKLLLAHLVLGYDIKPMKERPPNIWIGDFYIPQPNTKVFVKRRMDSW